MSMYVFPKGTQDSSDFSFLYGRIEDAIKVFSIGKFGPILQVRKNISFGLGLNFWLVRQDIEIVGKSY